MSRTLIDECKDGNINEVYKMIDDGADVNITTNNGNTPLHIASQNGHLQVVEVLIASGGLVNEANNYGNTPLSVAQMNGHTEIVVFLLREINWQRRKPIKVMMMRMIMLVHIEYQQKVILDSN